MRSAICQFQHGQLQPVGQQPCLKAGIAGSLVTVDYYDKTRLNPPDLGAIAYATATGVIIPTAPTSVTITAGATATTANALTVTASGSTATSRRTYYQYQWNCSTDNGQTWTGWNWSGATLPASNLVAGQTWKAQARATVDGSNYSAFVPSATIAITGIPCRLRPA